jgi:hypothetical protein
MSGAVSIIDASIVGTAFQLVGIRRALSAFCSNIISRITVKSMIFKSYGED